MCIGDDQTFAVLAKDSPQDKFRNHAGIDKVAEHAARPNGRQLIDITEKDQMTARIDRAQQVIPRSFSLSASPAASICSSSRVTADGANKSGLTRSTFPRERPFDDSIWASSDVPSKVDRVVKR